MGTAPGMFAWVAFSAPFAAGALCLYLGCRGRRTDDHPVCRQCGFDLFGLPRGGTNCSECGADLNLRHAVRVGHRKPLAGLIAAGLTMLLVAGSGLAVLGMAQRGFVDLDQWKPVWLLAHDMGSDDPPRRDAAIRELHNRLATGSFKQRHAPLVINPILKWQTQHDRPWHTAWAVLFEDAHARGLVSRDEFEQYAVNTFDVALRTRPVLRRGDALPYELELLVKGGRPPKGCTASWEITGHAAGGRRMTPDPDRMALRRHVRAYGTDPVIRADARALADVPDGLTTVAFDVTLQVRAAAPPRVLIAERLVTISNPVELVPPDRETVMTIRHPPAVHAAVAASVHVARQPANDAHGEWDVRIESDRAASLTLVAANPPVALAYDAFLRFGDSEWPLGPVVFPSGAASAWPAHRLLSAHASAAPFPRAARADVVLRPSVAAARATVDLTQIHGGTIEIRDLIVRRDSRKPSTAPTSPSAVNR